MVRYVSIRTNFTDEISTKVFSLSTWTGACHAPVFAGRGKVKNAVSERSISKNGRAIHDLLCPEIGHLEQAKKCSQNAQPSPQVAISDKGIFTSNALISFGQTPIIYSEYFMGGLLCLNI